jgi:hypothetical protein
VTGVLPELVTEVSHDRPATAPTRLRRDGSSGEHAAVSLERAVALPRFADDVPRVAELTGWDLTDWLS